MKTGSQPTPEFSAIAAPRNGACRRWRVPAAHPCVATADRRAVDATRWRNVRQLRLKPSISLLAQSSVCAMGSPLSIRTTIFGAMPWL